MSEEEKYPEQTQDLLDYGTALVDALEEHKGDDGKIDSGEIISTVITTAPEGMAAVIGSSEISKEIKAMSQEQMEAALTDATDTLTRLVQLFWEDKKDAE